MGTGDGLFAYHSARLNPEKFYLGIDANRRPLEKISEKLYRRPAKGGLPNLLFVHSTVEDLPAELDQFAAEICVNFPWGSLLRAVAGLERKALDNVRRACASGALLKVTFALDVERDAAEIRRLGLPAVFAEYLDDSLKAYYRNSGFEVCESLALSAFDSRVPQTTWSKRLSQNRNRRIRRIIARAVDF